MVLKVIKKRVGVAAQRSCVSEKERRALINNSYLRKAKLYKNNL